MSYIDWVNRLISYYYTYALHRVSSSVRSYFNNDTKAFEASPVTARPLRDECYPRQCRKPVNIHNIRMSAMLEKHENDDLSTIVIILDSPFFPFYL